MLRSKNKRARVTNLTVELATTSQLQKTRRGGGGNPGAAAILDLSTVAKCAPRYAAVVGTARLAHTLPAIVVQAPPDLLAQQLVRLTGC